jgi:hypothetical protein
VYDNVFHIKRKINYFILFFIYFKKRLEIFPSTAGMSITKLSLAGKCWGRENHLQSIAQIGGRHGHPK